jgi:crotonobetainyl-CoA:carnitine CoA-transferase CaiB-like acyl-CoA transferase
MGQAMMYQSVTGEPSLPWSVKESPWPVYDLFDTKDGEKIFVSIVGEEHWQGFCRHFEREAWLSDPRLATNQGRVDQRKWLIPEITAILREFPSAELSRTFERIGLPFAPVNTPSDLFDDPHLAASGGLLELRLPNGVEAKTPALPIALDGQRLGKRIDPPPIGGSTREILTELGFGDEEIGALAAQGTIGVASAEQGDIKAGAERPVSREPRQ